MISGFNIIVREVNGWSLTNNFALNSFFIRLINFPKGLKQKFSLTRFFFTRSIEIIFSSVGASEAEQLIWIGLTSLKSSETLQNQLNKCKIVTVKFGLLIVVQYVFTLVQGVTHSIFWYELSEFVGLLIFPAEALLCQPINLRAVSKFFRKIVIDKDFKIITRISVIINVYICYTHMRIGWTAWKIKIKNYHSAYFINFMNLVFLSPSGSGQ